MKNKDFLLLISGIVALFTLLYLVSSCTTKKRIITNQTRCETQLKY